MGARWYDPTIGRFTTADPSGQEVNLYLYAAGNPINNVDPTGLNACDTLHGCMEEGGDIGKMVGAGVGLLGAGAILMYAPSATMLGVAGLVLGSVFFGYGAGDVLGSVTGGLSYLSGLDW